MKKLSQRLPENLLMSTLGRSTDRSCREATGLMTPSFILTLMLPLYVQHCEMCLALYSFLVVANNCARNVVRSSLMKYCGPPSSWCFLSLDLCEMKRNRSSRDLNLTMTGLGESALAPGGLLREDMQYIEINYAF